MRILPGDLNSEDIEMCNGLHEMFDIFTAADRSQNDYAERFLKERFLFPMSTYRFNVLQSISFHHFVEKH